MARMRNRRSPPRDRMSQSRNGSAVITSSPFKLAGKSGNRRAQTIPDTVASQKEHGPALRVAKRAASACFSNSTERNEVDKRETLRDLLAYRRFVQSLSGELSRRREESREDASPVSEGGWRIKEVSDAEAGCIEGRRLGDAESQPNWQEDPDRDLHTETSKDERPRTTRTRSETAISVFPLRSIVGAGSSSSES